MDLYLARHDGDAATVEDFIACFAEASGRDLSQFFLWYRQSGTPEVSVATRHDAVAGTFSVTLSQRHRPTPGQTDKQPMVIPLAFGLVGEDGRDRPLLDEDGRQVAAVITLDEPQKTVTFSGHPTRPVLSINRGFSAPVALKTDLTAADLAFLAGHDGDAYNRWQAIQSLATEHLVGASRGNTRPGGADAIAAALAHVIDGAAADPAFAAQALTLPSEADIAREMGAEVDPAAVFAARKALKLHLSAALGDRLAALRERFATPGPYSPDAASAGRRALVNVALDLWAASGDDAASRGRGALRRRRQHDRPLRRPGRPCPASGGAARGGARRLPRALPHDALILDKWLALQAAIPEDGTLARVEALLADPAFAMGNPNRLRALVGGFATGNATQFNRPDGAGYAFLAGW